MLSTDEVARFRQLVSGYNKDGTQPASDSGQDVDTCMIFSLADLFKSFDAGKFYDLAERLHGLWSSKERESRARGAKKLLCTVRRKFAGIFRSGLQQIVHSGQCKELAAEKAKLEAYLDSLLQESRTMESQKREAATRSVMMVYYCDVCDPE